MTVREMRLVRKETLGERPTLQTTLLRLGAAILNVLGGLFFPYDGIKEWAKVERIPLHGGLYEYQRR